MNTPSLTRDIALRIGLAAHALPGIESRRLVEVLTQLLGIPLSEQRLASITVSDLKTGLSNLDGDEEGSGGGIPTECYKEAVRHLWGDDTGAQHVPEPVSYSDGVMPGSIRVACASNIGEQLDGHFGTCLRFLIYQVSSDQIQLVDVRSCIGSHNAEDKNAFRAALISDCNVMYVQSIGGPAAAKVVKLGIHPVKLPEGGEVRQILAQLQSVMSGSPPPWLAKIMGIAPEKRYVLEEDDDE